MIFEEILNRRALGVLATIDENKPQTRVLQALWTEGNKIFFSTGAQKPTFQQMEKIRKCRSVSRINIRL